MLVSSKGVIDYSLIEVRFSNMRYLKRKSYRILVIRREIIEYRLFEKELIEYRLFEEELIK